MQTDILTWELNRYRPDRTGRTHFNSFYLFELCFCEYAKIPLTIEFLHVFLLSPMEKISQEMFSVVTKSYAGFKVLNPMYNSMEFFSKEPFLVFPYLK